MIKFKKNGELTKESAQYLRRLDPSIRTTPIIVDGRKFFPVWMTQGYRETLPRLKTA